MPLSEKLRIELFFPDSPTATYSQLINQFENEITFTFGGCSVIQGIKGLYRSEAGKIVQDRIHLLFTDIAFSMTDTRQLVEAYVDALAYTISHALTEEKILIAVHSVFHQTP